MGGWKNLSEDLAELFGECVASSDSVDAFARFDTEDTTWSRNVRLRGGSDALTLEERRQQYAARIRRRRGAPAPEPSAEAAELLRKAAKAEANRRYRESPKGKAAYAAAQVRYRETEKGRAARDREIARTRAARKAKRQSVTLPRIETE